MKVLVVPSQYPDQNNLVGGIFVRDYAEAVGGMHDVRILAVSSTGNNRSISQRIQREQDHRIEIGRICLDQPKFVYKFKSLWYFWFFYKTAQLAECIWPDWRPDLIHAHTAFPGGVLAYRLSRKWNIPFVLTEHTGPFSKMMSSPIRAQLVRRVIRSAVCVLTVSEYQKQSIQAYDIPGQFRTIPNPVNTSLFAPSTIRANKNHLIFIGRIAPGKGLDVLLYTLASPEQHFWQLDIVGDGTYKQECQQLVEQLSLGSRIRFLGEQPKELLPGLIQHAEALILPSLQETFGIVLAESLACGRPVISTRCGGPQEFVIPEVGVLVEPNSKDELSRGLTEFASRRDQFSPEICSAYARAHFSYEVVGTQLDAVYRAVSNVSNEQ